MRYFIPKGTRVGVSNGRPDVRQAIFSDTDTRRDAWFDSSDLLPSMNPHMLIFRLPASHYQYVNTKMIAVDVERVVTKEPFGWEQYSLENGAASLAYEIDVMILDGLIKSVT